MTPNVLVSSAGRRVSLLRAFFDAVHPRGGRVAAGDVDSLAPSVHVADVAVELPRVNAPEFVPRLLDVVEELGIRLLVPTIDTELPVLAAHREAFAERGCVAVVSSPGVVDVSADKALFQEFMVERGVRVPRGWYGEAIGSAELPDQLFVKPRRGSSSINCFAATTETLAAVLPRVPEPIVQERVTAPEITIDALLDLDGTPLHYVPRERIRTQGGESIQGVTLDDGGLGEWIVQVLGHLSTAGAIGPVTLQAFLTADGPVLIEVNPRFGGGFPLTQAAGGSYPRWLVDLVSGVTVEPRLGDYERGVYMTRHHVEIFTRARPW